MGINLGNNDGPGNLRAIVNPQGTLPGDKLPAAVGDVIDMVFDCEFIENNSASVVTIFIKPVMQDYLISKFPLVQEFIEYVIQPGDRIQVPTFSKINIVSSLNYDDAKVYYHLAG